jgi:hypothetical protein
MEVRDMKRNREEELRAQANSKRSCFRVSYFIRFRKYARIKAKSGYAGVISKADEYRAKAENASNKLLPRMTLKSSPNSGTSPNNGANWR